MILKKMASGVGLIVATFGCNSGAREVPADAATAKAASAYAYYATLVRRQLNDSNPARVEQELACEGGRLIERFGGAVAGKEMGRIRDAVFDTASAETRRRVMEGIQLRGYDSNGPACDSLRSRADSVHPLPARTP
jgi:hypothetical protein